LLYLNEIKLPYRQHTKCKSFGDSPLSHRLFLCFRIRWSFQVCRNRSNWCVNSGHKTIRTQSLDKTKNKL